MGVVNEKEGQSETNILLFPTEKEVYITLLSNRASQKTRCTRETRVIRERLIWSATWTETMRGLFWQRRHWRRGVWWEGWGLGSSTRATAVSVLSVLRAIVKYLRLCRLHSLRTQQRVQHVKCVLVLVGPAARVVAIGVGLVRLGVRVVSLMVREAQRWEDIGPKTHRVRGHARKWRNLKWVSGGLAYFCGMGASWRLRHVSPFSGWGWWGARSYRVTRDLFATCAGRTWMFMCWGRGGWRCRTARGWVVVMRMMVVIGTLFVFLSTFPIFSPFWNAYPNLNVLFRPATAAVPSACRLARRRKAHLQDNGWGVARVCGSRGGLLLVMVVLVFSLLIHKSLGGSGVSLFHIGLHVLQLLFLCCQLIRMLSPVLAQRDFSRRVEIIGRWRLLSRSLPALGWGCGIAVLWWGSHRGIWVRGGKAHQTCKRAVRWCHGDHAHNGIRLVTILHLRLLGSLTCRFPVSNAF